MRQPNQLLLALFVSTSICAYSQIPTVSNLSPLAAPVGSTVTINGSGFDATPTNNRVYFGGVRASVVAATPTQLLVTVPVGAVYSPVRVNVGDVNATSAEKFTPSYPAGVEVFAGSFFATGVDGASGTSPYRTASANLDNDDKPDLIVANFSAGTVSVLRNTGSNGTVAFAAKADFVAGSNPYSVEAADLNNDGKLDLIVTNWNARVSVLLNNTSGGTIAFAPPVGFATGASTQGLALADLDGDGKLDIITSNSGAASISVLRNNSSGGNLSFETKMDFVTGNSPNGVTVTDIDGDGKVDVAVSVSSLNAIALFRNTSSSNAISFAPKVDLPTDNSPYAIVSGDLNGDGKPELATANYYTATLSVFRNQSTAGSFSFAARIDSSAGNPLGQSVHLAIGDLNGDGKPDLAIANRYNSTVALYRNASSGGTLSLGARVMLTSTQIPAAPQSVLIADWDNDGKSDLAITSNSGNKITVLRSIPPPKVTACLPLAAAPGSSVVLTGYNFRVTPSENTVFFGAAKATVTAASNTSLTVTVPNGATHSFPTVTTEGMTAHAPLPFVSAFGGDTTLIDAYAARTDYPLGSVSTDVAFSDLNGDGKNDLIATAPSGTVSLRIFANFSTPGTLNLVSQTVINTVAAPTEVTAGDLNGDGRPDIVIGTENQSVNAFRNTGSFQFAAGVVTGVPAKPSAVYIQDINGDGKPEILAATIPYVSILRNQSSANALSFAAPLYFSGNQPNSSQAMAVGDFDSDGKADIVFGNVFLKNQSTMSTISFAAPVKYTPDPHGMVAVHMASGDLNGDGKLDLATIYHNPNRVVTFLNTSSGGVLSFARQTAEYSTGFWPRRITIGDLNGDGKPDLAVANGDYDALSVYMNRSNGSALLFENKVDYATAKKPYSVAAGDLDNDGKADLVTSNWNGASLSVMRYQPYVPLPNVPTITSFAPDRGPVGTTVTINGTHFSSTPTDNIVYFGATKAQVVSGSPSTLTVKVPAGATYESFSVTNGQGYTVYSSAPFHVTFSGGGVFASNSFDSYISFPSGTYPNSVLLKDLDEDGKPDLLTANKNATSISVLRNTSTKGTVSFAGKVDIAAGTEPFAIGSGDFNGDGKQDIVVSNSSAKTLSLYQNNSTPGNISLIAVGTLTANVQSFGNPLGIKVRDMDGDGKADIVIAQGGTSGVSLFRNTSTNGIISFAPLQNYAGVSDVGSVAVTDFDGNGKPDVVSTAQTAVYSNTSIPGTISLTAPLTYNIGTTFSGVSTGDLNNDGKPDAVISGKYNAKVGFTVLKNESYRGTLLFKLEGEFGNPPFTSHRIAVDDLNGDGKLDVAHHNLYTSGVSLYRNRTQPADTISFAPMITYPYSNGNNSTMDAALGDVDGDGKPDVVIANASLNNVAVLRNRMGEPVQICVGGNVVLNSNLEGAFFQWQLSTDSVNFVNISDGANYSGTNTTSLQLLNVGPLFHNYRYRCVSNVGTSEVFPIRFGNTWTGAINNAWENPGNWSCGSVPDAVTDVVLNAGANVVISSNVTIASITVASGANVTVGTGFTLTLSGK